MVLELTPVNTDKRDALVGRLFQSTIEGGEMLSICIGDRLGLYAALHSAAQPLTSAALSKRANTAERYTREWLEQQAAAGFLECANPEANGGERTYTLPGDYAEVFLDPDSPYHLAPFSELFGVLSLHVPDVIEAFRTGKGVAYDRYGNEARRAQERMNRPVSVTLLPNVWLPQLPDISARLQSGARVADIGCGAGLSSIAIAQTYPLVTVDGFDIDEPSIMMARANAVAAGVADRVHFHVQDVSSQDVAGTYDVVMAFMMVHDVARPIETLRTMRRLAGAAGTVVVMDMRVADTFVAPAPPPERFAYLSSLLYCLPIGLAEKPSMGTGTVMRTSTLRSYARSAGFADVTVLPIEHDFFRFYRLELNPLVVAFDSAADRFDAAFSRVPAAALGFRPEGDEYALSGLLIHVASVLEYYSGVLALMAETDFAPIVAAGAPTPADVALMHDGIPPSARAQTVGRVREAHATFTTHLSRIPDITRKAEIRFGESPDPLPTSAADITGWVTDHYEEHIAHIDQLLNTLSSTQ